MQMHSAFSYFDTSGDGKLEEQELFESFVGVCPFDVDRERFSSIFKEIDINGDGSVCVDEVRRRIGMGWGGCYAVGTWVGCRDVVWWGVQRGPLI